MALFGRDGKAKGRRAAPPKTKGTPSMQIPDKLAEDASYFYGNQQFLAAFEKFGDTIDKLHTMYVTASQRIREPSSNDDVIRDGFVSALGASLAVDKNAWLGNAPEVSTSYLLQIADLCDREGLDDRRYRAAVTAIARELRLSS